LLIGTGFFVEELGGIGELNLSGLAMVS